jgi:glycine reductase
MAKEIERAGIPVAHVCSIVPISRTVGANRIVPAVAIPHPLGDPALAAGAEQALRRRLVERALEAVAAAVDGQRVFDPVV